MKILFVWVQNKDLFIPVETGNAYSYTEFCVVLFVS